MAEPWPEFSLCDRYEDEINKRTAAENEFVVLKKVSRVAENGVSCLLAARVLR